MTNHINKYLKTVRPDFHNLVQIYIFKNMKLRGLAIYFGSTQYKLLFGQYRTGVTPKQQLFGFIRVNVAKLRGENRTKFIVKTLLVFCVKYGAKLWNMSLFL